MSISKIVNSAAFFACLLISGLANGQKKDSAHVDCNSTQYFSLASFKSDTLSYLKKNFIVNNSIYLNKSVGYLINHLELPVLNYAVISGGNFIEGNEPEQCIGMYLYLCKDYSIRLNNSIFGKGSMPPNLIVFFKKPMLYETVIQRRRKIDPSNIGGPPPSFLNAQNIEKIEILEQKDY